MYILLYSTLLVVSFAGVLANLLSIPGNWVVLLSALVLSWYRGWVDPGWLALAMFTAVVLAGDIGEIMASALGAKKFGAGKGAVYAAMLGGIIGAILGVPVPPFSNILGALVGTFVGALVWELWRTRSLGRGAWAAIGAALGRLVGVSFRLLCGFSVWLALLVIARP